LQAHHRKAARAFARWIDAIGGNQAAADRTGIALRSIERMRAARSPIRPRLLRELAATADPDHAARLIAAAILIEEQPDA
jgi:predicted ABC-type sugar transport system permease subunit